MHLYPYTTGVRAQLTAAAALGDESTRATAEALATAAEPAVRLAVLEAVSAAADEITEALLDAPGSPTVAVRLDHDELRVEVRLTPVTEPTPAPADEGDNDARISLRLPEALKGQIETAARAEGVSVNTWLLRAANSALAPAPTFRHAAGSSGRITGWING